MIMYLSNGNDFPAHVASTTHNMYMYLCYPIFVQAVYSDNTLCSPNSWLMDLTDIRHLVKQSIFHVPPVQAM